MNTYPICDMGGLLYFALAVGFSIVIIMFTVIIVLETVILWRMKWGSFKKSFFVSVGLNIVSGIAGYILIRWIGEGVVVEIFKYQFWELLLVTFLLTVCIEGFILVLLKSDNWRLSLWSATVINIASYIWNAVVLLIIHHFLLAV
jgi:hypothetical protein